MTRCSTATSPRKKIHGGVDPDPVASQLQPPFVCPSSSPASFALPPSGTFGTHACAVQVSFDLHCASVLHETHLPLGTSHT